MRPPSGQTAESIQLEVLELTKTYGDFTAVDAASFTVEPGSMTGFLGANGSGKTTTMRMIMGLLEADKGQVLWQGRPLGWADRVSFGYMPEERGLYPKQGILSQLVYIGQLRGLRKSLAKERAAAYLTELGLGDRLSHKLESLSLGNQQRVQIVAALLHQPKALILDEPFSGLDPQAVDTMVGMLGQFLERGVPVLFSSHQLDLVDRLCDRVVILADGKIKAAGSAADLRQLGPLRFQYRASQDAAWLQDFLPRELAEVLELEAGEALIQIKAEQELESIRQRILEEGLQRGMQEFYRLLPSLGDIYREVTK